MDIKKYKQTKLGHILQLMQYKLRTEKSRHTKINKFYRHIVCIQKGRLTEIITPLRKVGSTVVVSRWGVIQKSRWIPHTSTGIECGSARHSQGVEIGLPGAREQVGLGRKLRVGASEVGQLDVAVSHPHRLADGNSVYQLRDDLQNRETNSYICCED